MAYPTGIDFKHTSSSMGMQPINETSTTQKHPLGMVVTAKDTNYGVGEFVYCVGVASTAAGDLCCYDSKNGDTARAVHGGSTSTGSCGVAMSANVASQYGWYQISGAGPVLSGTVSADAPIYLTSTAGSVDDTVVAGDKVTGMVARSATSSGYTTVQMDRPSITSESSAALDVSQTAAIDATVIVANAAATKASILKVTLTANTEGGNAIVVDGVVEDLAGLDASAAKTVLCRTLALTAAKGAMTVTVGTAKKTTTTNGNGVNELWLETTAAGLFSVSVANDVAEITLFTAQVEGGITALTKLTFT